MGNEVRKGAEVRVMLYSKGRGEPLVVSSGDVLSKSDPGQTRSGINQSMAGRE